MHSLTESIAKTIEASHKQVNAAIELLDQGCTVPFIARYRKEATGALDDSQLRTLEQRLIYLRELEQRRSYILERLGKDSKLTAELQQQLQSASSKTALEELYQPYKSSRKSKADSAREAGLEAMLNKILEQPGLCSKKLAQNYIRSEGEFSDRDGVLSGIEALLHQRLMQTPSLLAQLRGDLWNRGLLVSKVAKGKAEEKSKFSDYFDYQETIKSIPSHRLLAILRGQQQEMLKIALQPAEDYHPEKPIYHHLKLNNRHQIDSWLEQAIQLIWRRKLLPYLQRELITRARQAAEISAIEVFARNLKQLLLAAPAGHKVTLGLDPGLRTGVKCAVVDGTGKLLSTATIYPHVPKNQWSKSIEHLKQLCLKHQVELISIGNGTGSKETDRLVEELLSLLPTQRIHKLMVNEAGASVYSASKLAAKEFPDLDVTLRGAASIARRLQDPLAELVKIEAKAIGVGQYQHDVDQQQLTQRLDAVVEDCVNSVGVDLNSASQSLLQHVSGLSPSLAGNIVQLREQLGKFNDRKQLLDVPRLGPKAFEQAAGFLRIADGSEPLDRSAVHPETYPLVRKIAQKQGCKPAQLIGDSQRLGKVDASQFCNSQFGEMTIRDILAELEKPGRDPRPEFKTARFREDINEPSDLYPDLQLQGVVTNVTNFGAFVDIGVHQDGLVHISQLADQFVKDPHALVSAGDIVNVRVLEVDLARKRIALTMRSSEAPAAKDTRKRQKKTAKPNAQNTGLLAQKLNQALNKKR